MDKDDAEANQIQPSVLYRIGPLQVICQRMLDHPRFCDSLEHHLALPPRYIVLLCKCEYEADTARSREDTERE